MLSVYTSAGGADHGHAPPQIILSNPYGTDTWLKNAREESDKDINDFAVTFDGKEF